jgi:hypothetical protein
MPAMLINGNYQRPKLWASDRRGDLFRLPVSVGLEEKASKVKSMETVFARMKLKIGELVYCRFQSHQVGRQTKFADAYITDERGKKIFVGTDRECDRFAEIRGLLIRES